MKEMAPTLDIAGKDFERAKSLLKLANVNYSIPASNSSDDFVYVPSINLYVARQRTLQGKNWFECHKELQNQGERMLTLPEFVEFLKYTENNLPEVYKDITEVKNPWRAEWIDADFKTKGRNLYVNSSHILDSKGNLIPQVSEILDRNTLMIDSRISLGDFLHRNNTSQGLPTKNVESGGLYYWYPRSDNNSVARFGAGSGRTSFDCDGNPSSRDSDLGVRAVRHE
jgi:hypothetical protein